MILGSVGFMLGTGGNAVVSKALCEKREEKANEIFSMLIYASIVIGVILAVIGIALARPIAELLASGEKDMTAENKAILIDYCAQYARIILITLPAFMLQNAFQGFFVTAEKARLGLYVTIIAGLGNVIFDALFVAVFKWGLVGAAIATAMNQFIGGIIPLSISLVKTIVCCGLVKPSSTGKSSQRFVSTACPNCLRISRFPSLPFYTTHN
jgi:Na+-driven multidrug efflux pump